MERMQIPGGIIYIDSEIIDNKTITLIQDIDSYLIGILIDGQSNEDLKNYIENKYDNYEIYFNQTNVEYDEITETKNTTLIQDIKDFL